MRLLALELEPADVVFVRSDGFFGRLIRKVTRDKSEPETLVNHVGLITRLRRDGHPLICEALPSGVVRRPLGEAYGHGPEYVAVYRHRALTFENKVRVASWCERFMGGRYGFLKIGLHLLGKVLRRRGLPIRAEALCWWDSRPICSYAVAVSFAAEFPDMTWSDRLAREADPDDMWDEVQNAESWRCIMPLSRLKG